MSDPDPSVGKGEPVSERTKADILDAARQCILRYGIRRTSIQEVARFAHVSRGSVYRYFPDKPALISAVIDRSSAHNMAVCGELVARQPTLARQVGEVGVWLRARAVGDLFFRLDETEPETLAVMLTTQSGVLVRTWVEFWRPLVVAAKIAGEIRRSVHVDRASEWIARALLSLVVGDAVTFDADDPKQLRRYLRDFIVAGLR